MAGYSEITQRLLTRNQDFQSTGFKYSQHVSSQYSLNLRKAKRHSSHNKKRQIQSSLISSSLPSQIQSLLYSSLSRSELFTSIFLLQSPPITQQELLQGLQLALAPKLSKDLGPEIQPELISRLIDLLDYSPEENCKLILDILINLYYYYSITIESSLNIKTIQVLYKFLNGKNEELASKTVWVITNIVGNDRRLKESLGEKGFGMVLVRLFNEFVEEKSISILLWAIKIFFKDFPRFSGNWVVGFIKKIKHVIRYYEEKTVKIAANILYFIADKNNEFIDCYFSFGIVSELFNHLKSESPYLIYPILNLLNLISSSENEDHTQRLLDLNILSELSILSASEDLKIRKLSFFGYSNIAAGTKAQRRLLIEDFSFIKIFDGLNDPEYEVINEAVICLSNLAALINESELEQLYQLGVFNKLEKLIKSHSVVFDLFGTELLSFIDKLLRYATRSQMTELSQTGLQDCIDSLVLNENCSELAQKVLKNHFSENKVDLFTPNTFHF